MSPFDAFWAESMFTFPSTKLNWNRKVLNDKAIIEERSIPDVKGSRDKNLKALSAMFGVTLPTMFNVINRDTWRDVL